MSNLKTVSKITASEMGFDKLNIQLALKDVEDGEAIPIASIVGKVASIEVGTTSNGECTRVRGSFRATPDGVEYFKSGTLFPPAVVADALVAQAIETGIESTPVDPTESDEKRFKVFKRFDPSEPMVLEIQIEAVKAAATATGYKYRAVAMREETAASDPLLALLQERRQALLGPAPDVDRDNTVPVDPEAAETDKAKSKKKGK